MQIRPEHVKEIVTSGNVSRAVPDVGQVVLGGWRAGLWPTSPKRTSFLEPCPAAWPVHSRKSRCLAGLGAVACCWKSRGPKGEVNRPLKSDWVPGSRRAFTQSFLRRHNGLVSAVGAWSRAPVLQTAPLGHLLDEV